MLVKQMTKNVKEMVTKERRENFLKRGQRRATKGERCGDKG